MQRAVIDYQSGTVVYCMLTEDGIASSKYTLENNMILFLTNALNTRECFKHQLNTVGIIENAVGAVKHNYYTKRINVVLQVKRSKCRS